MTECNTSPLIVMVSGGGPVGLTFSLNLVMMMGEEQDKIRCDQVVTLQDHVIEQLPEYIQKKVWSTSRNLPIRLVEDRLFDLIQSFVCRYCNISMVSEGIEYVCGVAYDIPMKVSSLSEEPLHQALNFIL
ncbi:hypothetical protein I4U23_021853 [Adineta vaga]|nr:hypothetical protein I4U23_021853 [Adineta vaga]